MAYNTSKGPRDLGDIVNEDDVDTQIDFGPDQIALKTNNIDRLTVTNVHVSSSVNMSASIFYGDASGLTNLAGAGAVVGPDSSATNTVAKFDNTTGKLITGSNVLIDGLGNISTPAAISASLHMSASSFVSVYESTFGSVIVSGAGPATISGSGTLVTMGATTLGSALNVSGNVFVANLKTIGRDDGVTRNANIQFADVGPLGNAIITLRDGGDDLMVVDGGGNIGIGTSIPSHKLTVVGAISGSNLMRLGSSLSASGDVAVTGAVHAANFYGDAFGLTNFPPALPAGANMQVQFNSGSVLKGSSNFTFAYDLPINQLQITGDISASNDSQVGRDIFIARDATVGNDVSAGRDVLCSNDISASRDLKGGRDFILTRDAVLGGNLNVPTITASAHVSASFFMGDGSGLTNLPAGSGDVTGPGSSVATSIAIFDGTSGKAIASSTTTIDGGGNISAPGFISASSYISASSFITSDGKLRIEGGSQGLILNETGHLVIQVIPADKNLRLKLGDDVGITQVQVRNGSNNTVTRLFSNGDISGSGRLMATGDSYLGGALNVTGGATFAGDLTWDQNAVHIGDPDTYYGFPAVDTINVVAGGFSALKLDASVGSKKIELNNTNADIDVQMMADDGNVILHTDAALNRVGIGTDVPTHTLAVVGEISASAEVIAGSFTGANLNRGYVNKLVLSRPTVSTIIIATGSCTDSTDSVYMNNTASITVDITDSGIDGLDNGTEASSTWYAVHLVSGTAGMGGLLVAGEGVPFMPAGYTYYRRVGWTYNYSDGNLQNFAQGGLGRERSYFWNYTDVGAFANVVTNGTSNGFRTAVDCSGKIAPSAHTYTLAPRPGAGSDQYRDQVNIIPLATSGSAVGWVIIRGFKDDSGAGGAGITRAPVEFPIHRGDGQIVGFDYITYYNGDLTAWLLGWKETI